MDSVTTLLNRQLGLVTHRLRRVPIVVLMPHSRCNCRCVMCDIWKGNRNRQELTRDDLAPHVGTLARLGVEQVVFSGGEALMHSNLWTLCEMLRDLNARLTLLSTGLLLDKHAAEIVRHIDEVIVSLDGSREVHDGIRRVPRAFDQLTDGVAALRRARPGFPVTGRSVLQRQNYADLPNIVEAARAIGLDRISFLAADVSTEAFNRADPWDAERQSDVALTLEQAREFEAVVEDLISNHRRDFDDGFIAESRGKMRHLARYYLALLGEGDFPPVRCNAPWVSTVIEADGTVRPCFFHGSFGNVRERPIDEILNADEAVAFRRQLDVAQDPICRRCVCSLHLKTLW